MDCVEIVNSGVHEFKGEKKYVATGSLENDNILNHVNVTYNSRPSRANMEFNKNDVIFAKMKDTEKVFLIDEETSHNLYSTGFAGLRIKQNNKIIPKFLYFWIKSPVFQKEKNRKSGGATQKAINNSKIKEFTLFVPPIETQKKIVEILEKAEKLKEYRQKSDELTDSLLKSVFFQMFGDIANDSKNWDRKSFLESIEKTVAPNEIKIPKSDYLETGNYPIVDQGQNFIAGYSNDENKLFTIPLPIILFGDHTRVFKYIDFPFSLGADGAKIIIPKKELFNLKFLFYYLKNIKLENHGYSRHYKYLKKLTLSFPQ
jgi:restriction endonuclease S subunit